MFDLLGKKKKKEDIVSSIVSVSKVTSIQEISAISEIDVDEVCVIIEKLISKSKNDSQYNLFRNAYIDKKNNEIVIAKFTKNGGIATTITRIFSSKTDWKCSFCNTTNKGKSDKCVSCGAGRK